MSVSFVILFNFPILALGYNNEISNHPVTKRLHQVAKLYLFSPSAGLTTCPMAMTDGAIKTLKVSFFTSS